MLDAITMPSRFGMLVLTHLRTTMLAGPVIAGPGGRLLTFLTQPANVRCPVLPPDLRPAGVRLVPAGEDIVLPRDSGPGSWLVRPSPATPLAIWSVVIGAARRAAASGTTGRIAS
jgi:hypothetical protein